MPSSASEKKMLEVLEGLVKSNRRLEQKIETAATAKSLKSTAAQNTDTRLRRVLGYAKTAAQSLDDLTDAQGENAHENVGEAAAAADTGLHAALLRALARCALVGVRACARVPPPYLCV